LHRTFAFSKFSHESCNEAPFIREEMFRLYDVPRRLCLDSALQIAEILSHHQHKYQKRTIFATSVQHANAAATVLTKTLRDQYPHADSAKHQRALEVLTDYIRFNATTYDAANKMMAQLEPSARSYRAAPGPPSHPPLASAAFPTRRHQPLGSPRCNVATRVVLSRAVNAGITTPSGTISPCESSTTTVNWPNFGNIMYGNEIAFLGVDGISGNP